jgi:ribosomal protein S19
VNKNRQKKKKKSSITLFNRNSLIPNTLLNKKIFIYTGLRFISIKVKSMHLGLRLGEFVLTRRLKSNKKRKKGKK